MAESHFERAVTRIASLARELGGTASALRRAAAQASAGLSWREDAGYIEVWDGSGGWGTLYSRQSRTPYGYRDVIETTMVRSSAPTWPEVPVQQVPWQLLPPGEHPFPAILRHFEALQAGNPTLSFDRSRIERLSGLGPSSVYIGRGELDRYVVFAFHEREWAVLDCPIVGNAAYLLPYSQWESLSRHTKAELLKGHSSIRRVVHRGDWFGRIAALLERAKPARVTSVKRRASRRPHRKAASEPDRRR